MVVGLYAFSHGEAWSFQIAVSSGARFGQGSVYFGDPHVGDTA